MEELKPHLQLVRLYKDIFSADLLFDVTTPAVPWSMVKGGGYVAVAKADFIR